MFGLVAATNAAARRRARREAEMLAAPHWRPLGRLRILATDRRLLVWHQAEWASVWSHAIRELQPALEVGRLDMTRSEERRVGKECGRACRSRGSPVHKKNKKQVKIAK